MISTLSQAADLAASIKRILAGKEDPLAEDRNDSQRVSLTRWLGQALGLSGGKLEDLITVSRVYDVGVAWMPGQTLLKEDKLADEEWDEMIQHVAIGYEVAMSTPEISHLAHIILHHHEWWDGSGYPGLLKRDSIPVESRIIAIVDAYDSMVSGRPYRKQMSHEKALAELRRCAGSQFDPQMVMIFTGLFLS